MTHEKYNELQKKMDKLASDFVYELAEIETQEDLTKVSEWLDEKEKSLDLNKLTIYQLQEYIDLQQALELAEKELDLKLAKKELAEYQLDEFIERMTK